MRSVTEKPRVRTRYAGGFAATQEILNPLRLKTICEEGACPNLPTCWAQKHAAFMILGDTCTRACSFCHVKTGRPTGVDANEPQRIAAAVAALKLSHVVITSVNRDDLPDGGAGHFVQVMQAIRQQCPGATLEVLTPDFMHKPQALAEVIAAAPDVYNHNIETVPRLYPSIRPGARYFNSLNLLRKAADAGLYTKSGLMVGLGELQQEVFQVMDDLRAAAVDFLTIGQYLQPTPHHAPVKNYISDEMFKEYEDMAWGKGFLMVSASPLTRSSYHAGEDFEKLRQSHPRKQFNEDNQKGSWGS